MIIFYPLIETGNLFWASFVSAYNSFFLIPLVPIMLELSCELAFPVGEGSAAGMLFAMGNFSGFLLGLFLSLIVQGESKGQSAAGLGFCFGVFVIGFLLVYNMKEERNRSDFEKMSEDRRRSERSIDGSQLSKETPSDEGKVEDLLEKK